MSDLKEREIEETGGDEEQSCQARELSESELTQVAAAANSGFIEVFTDITQDCKFGLTIMDTGGPGGGQLVPRKCYYIDRGAGTSQCRYLSRIGPGLPGYELYECNYRLTHPKG